MLTQSGSDLIALVDIHHGFGKMADYENNYDPSEQGCHCLIPPKNRKVLKCLSKSVVVKVGQ